MAKPFTETVIQARLVLGQGSVLERLNRMEGVEVDPHVGNAPLVYDEVGRLMMAGLYRQYLDIGQATGLPMLLTTPTWRANRERIEAAGYNGPDLINEAVSFVQELRAEYGQWGANVYIGGLLACRGDAYRADEALGMEEAVRFHQWQAFQLADAGVDYLRAATLPALSEARGIARVFAELEMPYSLSFVIRADGRLLDGTSLDRAIDTIDDSATRPPDFYTINCVHPRILTEALSRLPERVTQRLWGLLANASELSPEQLDGAKQLLADSPEELGRQMATLHKAFHLRLLGGCCGTDQRHIQAIVDACTTPDGCFAAAKERCR